MIPFMETLREMELDRRKELFVVLGKEKKGMSEASIKLRENKE